MYDRRIRDVAVTERDQPTWTPTPRSEAVDESTVTSGSCSSPRPLNCKWNGCGEVFASLTALHSHLNRTHLQAELYEDAQPNHSHSHGYHHHHVNDQVDSAKRAYSSRENEYASYTDVHHNKRPSPLDILGHVASLQSATSCHSPSASTSAYHNGQYTADRASSSGTHQSSRPWAIPKQPQDQLQYHHYDTMVDQVPAYSPRYHHDLPISPRFGVTDSRQRFKRRQVGSSLGTDSSVLEKPLSAPVLSAHGLTAKMEQEHHGVNTGDHYVCTKLHLLYALCQYKFNINCFVLHICRCIKATIWQAHMIHTPPELLVPLMMLLLRRMNLDTVLNTWQPQSRSIIRPPMVNKDNTNSKNMLLIPIWMDRPRSIFLNSVLDWRLFLRMCPWSRLNNVISRANAFTDVYPSGFQACFMLYGIPSTFIPQLPHPQLPQLRRKRSFDWNQLVASFTLSLKCRIAPSTPQLFGNYRGACTSFSNELVARAPHYLT